MDELFEKNQKRKDDPSFVYDMAVEFPQDEQLLSCSWDTESYAGLLMGRFPGVRWEAGLLDTVASPLLELPLLRSCPPVHQACRLEVAGSKGQVQSFTTMDQSWHMSHSIMKRVTS
ncbi:hypothetical protein A6R68_06520 [Neotoma lepida]|uniref:Centrosomal protein of 19 kDa n=1 Tax=Neotoma lepida TaxID=56216 RepID=A0A1A6GGP6_NEOLE|nr:hypothetical protein A6R68_06520 [Neotoma lepida]